VANQEKIYVQMIASEAEQFAYLGQFLATQLDAPQKQRDLDAAAKRTLASVSRS
jgi:hypothetical protein